MNQSPENESEALRSDIDVTRRRMDDTIDALGDRMQPRHLLDEVLGYFRRTDSNGNTRLSTMRDKVSHGTDTAVHAVVDSIKQNPLPALLIGAGVAWMIYESRRDKSGSYSDSDYMSETEPLQYDPDAHLDRPLEYPGGTGTSSGISEAGWSETDTGHPKSTAREKLSHAGEAAREKMSAMRHAAGEKLTAARERAGEMGARVKQRTGEMYTATRERVATTADQHPIELGLACLAAGVVVGLAMPTPRAVNRRLGPAADRLRERARESGHEMLEKGKRVATAAMSAAKDEAQAQGLTPEALREKSAAIADRAKEAGRESARREGIDPGSLSAGVSNPPEGNQSGSHLNDPTIARPPV